MLLTYNEELLAPRPTPNLEENPLSAVREFLFSISTATLHIWKTTSPCTTWKHAMSWWRGHIYHGHCCSAMKTLCYTGECAYANDLPVLAQGLGVVILMTPVINGSRFPKILNGFQQNLVQQPTAITSSFSSVGPKHYLTTELPALLKVRAFCAEGPCCFVGLHKRFGRPCCLHLPLWRSK